MNISPTLNCNKIIDDRKKLNLPTYNLGLGANSLKQPEYFINRLEYHADKKNYTSYDGIPKFKHTIIEKFSLNNYKVKNVLTGNGLKELLFIVQLAFKGIIYHITPSWVSYKEQILALNKLDNLEEIETKIENNFEINLIDLENKMKKYKDENKLIIFNNPNNPTGVMYNKEQVKKIADILNKYNCIILADEIYSNLNHFNNFNSIANYAPKLTIRGTSLSKDLGCGGYRLGWMTFPKELTNFFKKCAGLASTIYSCVTTPLLYATHDILNKEILLKNHYIKSNQIYKKCVKDFCEILEKSKLKYVKPNSCWYVFVDFSYYKIILENLNIKNSIDLTQFLLNKFGIICVAGKYFNYKGLTVRFSLVELENKNLSSKILNIIQEMINFLTSLL